MLVKYSLHEFQIGIAILSCKEPILRSLNNTTLLPSDGMCAGSTRASLLSSVEMRSTIFQCDDSSYAIKALVRPKN